MRLSILHRAARWNRRRCHRRGRSAPVRQPGACRAASANRRVGGETGQTLGGLGLERRQIAASSAPLLFSARGRPRALDGLGDALDGARRHFKPARGLRRAVAPFARGKLDHEKGEGRGARRSRQHRLRVVSIMGGPFQSGLGCCACCSILPERSHRLPAVARRGRGRGCLGGGTSGPAPSRRASGAGRRSRRA